MKGIISSHSALTAYQRQTAVEPVAPPASPRPQEGEGVGASVGGAARLSISSRAREMASGSAGIDSAKIEALRQSIRSGTLKFDSAAIAEKMIDQGE